MRAALLAAVLALQCASAFGSQGCPGLDAGATIRDWAALSAKEATLIFEGDLFAIEELLPGSNANRSSRTLRFKIQRLYKGEGAQVVQFETEIKLEPGIRYLVYAFGEGPDDGYHIWHCFFPQETAHAGAELRYLRGEAPEPDDLLTFRELSRKQKRPDAGKLCGSIRSEYGEPFPQPEARAWFKSKDGWDWDHEYEVEAKIREGRYCFLGLRPGAYVVGFLASSIGWQKRSFGLSGGALRLDDAPLTVVYPNQEETGPDIVLESEPTFTVTGRLLFPGGRAPRESEGFAIRLDPQPHGPFERYLTAELLEGGHFVIRGVPARRYRLDAWPTHPNDESNASMEITVNGNLSGITVLLKPKSTRKRG